MRIGAHIRLGDNDRTLSQQIIHDLSIILCDLIVSFFMTVGSVITRQIDIVFDHNRDAEKQTGRAPLHQSLIPLSCHLQCVIAKGDEAVKRFIVGGDTCLIISSQLLAANELQVNGLPYGGNIRLVQRRENGLLWKDKFFSRQRGSRDQADTKRHCS